MNANYVVRTIPAHKRRWILVGSHLDRAHALVDADHRLLLDEERGIISIMSDDVDVNELLQALQGTGNLHEEDVPETTRNEWQFVPSLNVQDLKEIVDLRLTNLTQSPTVPLPRLGDMAVLESGVCRNMCLPYCIAKMDLEPGASANVRILRFDTATRMILASATFPRASSDETL